MKTTENASTEFIKNISEAQAMLSRLKNTTEDFFNMDPYLVHWGHVGNVAYIAQQLKLICDRVFNEGEHSA